MMKQAAVFILTGERGAGKTTRLREVAAELIRRKFPVSGFIAEANRQDTGSTGYILKGVNHESEVLL